MPAVRTAKPALAWRYPTRTPAAVRIVSPPAPGRARAASAASEMGSTPAALRIISPATPPDGAASPDSDPVSGSSLEAGRKNDCASPGSDDAPPTWVIAAEMDAAIPPSGATPVAMSATGIPGIPANAQRSGNSDATHACTAADSAALSIRSPCVHYRLHPGDAEQEGSKLGLQLRDRDDRTGNRGEHVLNQRDDIRHWRHPGDAHQEGIKVGLQLRDRYDRTGTRGEHVLNQRLQLRERDDRTGTRGEHVLNQRLQLRERDDRTGTRGEHVLNQRLQLRERDDRTGTRGGHVLNQRVDVRNWGDRNWGDQIGYRRDRIRN